MDFNEILYDDFIEHFEIIDLFNLIFYSRVWCCKNALWKNVNLKED